MSMKEAFDIYFARLKEYWQKEEGSYPKMYFDSCCHKHLTPLILKEFSKDEHGRSQWQPIAQTKPIDFEILEKKLGFSIHQSIKDYFSYFWFVRIEGWSHLWGYIWLNGVFPTIDILNQINGGFEDGKDRHYLNDDIYFPIGGCDSESFFINNRTGEVTAVIPYEQYSEHFSNSLENIIKNIFMYREDAEAMYKKCIYNGEIDNE